MAVFTSDFPARRAELVIKPFGEGGQYVVKDARSGEYFQFDEQAAFLLLQLDGTRDHATLSAEFEARFGEPLPAEDLEAFLESVGSRGLLEASGGRESPGWAVQDAPTNRGADAPRSAVAKRQTILHWRKSLFDPDRFFTALEPRIRFFWTGTFLAISAACILLAVGLVWAGRHEIASSVTRSLRWETLLLAWVVTLGVTFLHEFAHGLTCKHYGGEVHEVGFLLLMLMPCFFCNVSDAWLFREKSKRMWVTLAGGYFELFLWALAVFVWRLTIPESLLNYVAFVVMSVCGVQTLFNFNPLIKLDGYYLLSDALEISNLQQRSTECFRAHARWLLWGAPRPESEPHGRTLLMYGATSWCFSVVFLCLMLVAMQQTLGTEWNVLGAAFAIFIGYLSLRGLFTGFFSGEVQKMITRRRIRTAFWVLAAASVPPVLFAVQIEDRSSGTFQVRPVTRSELRAPVAGFLREVLHDEGDRIDAGALVARLDVPDLQSRLAQKRAEVLESQARLQLLEVGPRYEEVQEQRRRVARTETWREQARVDLTNARQALEHDLARLDSQIKEYRAELAFAEEALQRSAKLVNQRSVSEVQHHEAEKNVSVVRSQLEQAEAQKKSRRALGTNEPERELTRNEKELAEARAALVLMEAGTRPEEIAAERARLARLDEEVRYLETLEPKLLVASPVAGLVTTPRLKEQVGQYLREGDLICVVEEPSLLEAEISLAEQDVFRVRSGHAVALKARAHPLMTFPARLERLAPRAEPGEVQSTVTAYCRLEDPEGRLRPGMTGHARVYTGRRPVGAILFDRALRFLRTEFWW
jgi:multidrug efflux pump subunit AcrA (membrane-fusion protein)